MGQSLAEWSRGRARVASPWLVRALGLVLDAATEPTLRGVAGCLLLVVAAGAGLGASSLALAQELEPRAYAPNPKGASFLLLAYGHSAGDVVFDSSLPVSDTRAAVSSTALLYGRTFGLAGRSASLGLGVPYVWGTVEGEVAEEFRRIRRSGLADTRLRFSMNLVGGPAMKPAEFAQRRPRTTLGTSLLVHAPTGQYDPAKLINLGTNRWSFKPEVGVSHPRGRLYLEFYAGVWLFTDNDDFFGGQHRRQDPIAALQAHVSYSFRPRLWVAADATFYRGGGTMVAGVPKDDLQENSRLGLTAAFPVGRRHSVKLSWGSGFTTRFGGDFQTLGIAWQVLWLGRVRN